MKKLKALYRRYQLWTGARLVCPVHGEVRRHILSPYYVYSPCQQCDTEAWKAEEAKEEQRLSERRIAELAAAIRASHPVLVQAIREAVVPK